MLSTKPVALSSYLQLSTDGFTAGGLLNSLFCLVKNIELFKMEINPMNKQIDLFSTYKQVTAAKESDSNN